MRNRETVTKNWIQNSEDEKRQRRREVLNLDSRDFFNKKDIWQKERKRKGKVKQYQTMEKIIKNYENIFTFKRFVYKNTLCESLMIKDITAQFSYDHEDLSHGKNNICYSTVLNYHIRQIEKQYKAKTKTVGSLRIINFPFVCDLTCFFLLVSKCKFLCTS